MLNQFKTWILEIENNAIDEKKAKAEKKGSVDAWKKQIWSAPDKNSAIKYRFRDEGERLGYRSRPSYKTKAGEWLYDFVWREMDKDGRLVRVVLAMEIEVSECKLKSIRYDFNKLLQAEADYKIMVFQQKTEDDADAVFEDLRESHSAYHRKTQSSYLMCGWITSTNSFKFSEVHDLPFNTALRQSSASNTSICS